MHLGEVPLLTKLAGAKRVLLAGAGGGFDFMCGIPLRESLRARGKEVFLANLSFTYLGGTNATYLTPALAVVDATTEGEPKYFPERYACEWLESRGERGEILCFDKVGVAPLRAAYRAILERHDIDAIVLIDGGTDILMRGDEAGLGTPAEDMTSLAAVNALDVPHKYVACLGFGIDAFHGVCHAHFLEAAARLTRIGGFLGAWSLLPEMPESRAYLEAVEYVHGRMAERGSIVNASIASALEGHFGNHHRLARTRNSELFINPLMAMYWGFDLGAVARESLYLADLERTQTIWDVQAIIEAFRRGVKTRPRVTIPV